MKKYLSPLEPDGVYHIFNRANGSDLLFRSEVEYQEFLRLIKQYLKGYVRVYGYCLMPNHFHIIIEVLHPTGQFVERLNKSIPFTLVLSRKFASLFSAYAQWINHLHGRRGSVFMKPFKRVRIQDRKQLWTLVRYVHLNPVEAGLCRLPGEWKYSSFQDSLNCNNTWFCRAPLVELMGGKLEFLELHGLLDSGGVPSAETKKAPI